MEILYIDWWFFWFSPSPWIHLGVYCTEDCLPSTQWGLCGRLLRHEHIVTRLFRAVSVRAKWGTADCRSVLSLLKRTVNMGQPHQSQLSSIVLFHDVCNAFSMARWGGNQPHTLAAENPMICLFDFDILVRNDGCISVIPSFMMLHQFQAGMPSATLQQCPPLPVFF